MNCPSCHVAVPNGYARCPRCQHALPVASRATTTFGGTVVQDRRFPIVPVAISAVVVIGIVAFIATRGGAKREEIVTMPDPVPAAPQPAPAIAAPRPPVIAAPPPVVRGPSAIAAGDALLKVLRHQRLWSTVDASPPRIDVRSQSCGDPGMTAAIEAARPALRDAGLTVLRCLEESGRVVFQRDL